MDAKGHNYKKLHMNSRHYGTGKNVRALKKQIYELSGSIESLKLDIGMQQKTLRMLEEQYRKTKSKQTLDSVNEKKHEIDCIQKNILKKESLQSRLSKDLEYATVQEKAEAVYTKSENRTSTIWSWNKVSVKSKLNRFKRNIKNAEWFAKAYADGDDGTKAAQATIEAASGVIAKAGRKTYRTAAYVPKKIIKTLLRNITKSVVKAAAKAIKQLAGIVIKLVSKFITALAASSAGVLLLIIIAIFLIVILITRFDIGWFIGGNTDMASSNDRYTEVQEYISTLQGDFNKQIKREAGNDVPISDEDPDNTNDMLVTYICLTFDFEKFNGGKLTDKDKDILKNIFYTMCDYSIDTKQPDDADEAEEENGEGSEGKGGKSEPEVTGCTIIRHNLSWAVDEFEFTKEQLDTLEIISELSDGAVRKNGVIIAGTSGGTISGYVPDIGISVSWPTVSNTITSAYGDTEDRNKPHKGVDVAPLSHGTAGDPVYAAADGIIKIAQWNNETAGNYVAITHEGGLYTRYLHMCDITVSEGDTVKRGQIIGHMGTTGDSTGVHLHFDFSFNGTYINPMAYFKD